MSNKRIIHHRAVREPGWNTMRSLDKQIRKRSCVVKVHIIHTNWVERFLILCNLCHKKERMQKKNPGLIYEYDFERCV